MLAQRAPDRRRRHHGRGARRPRGDGRAAAARRRTRDRLAAGRARPRGAVRLGGADAGVGRRARSAPRPVRARPGVDARRRRLRAPPDRLPPATAVGAMGAEFETRHGYVEGVAGAAGPARLVGRVVLEYPSHTATDNLLMAAVLAKGTTVIENAAREPEVCDLAAFLNAMGAASRGAGTSRIEVEGVEELRPGRPHGDPDRVVAATYLAAVGLAGGEVVVEDARVDHMEMLRAKTDVDGHGDRRNARRAAARRRRAAAVGRRRDPAVPGRGDRLQAVARHDADRGRRRRASSPRTSSPGASATSTSSGGWARTSAPRATTPSCAGCRGSRGRRCGRPTSGPGRRWCWPAWSPTGVTEVADAHHVDRGYEDLAAGLASLGAG